MVKCVVKLFVLSGHFILSSVEPRSLSARSYLLMCQEAAMIWFRGVPCSTNERYMLYNHIWVFLMLSIMPSDLNSVWVFATLSTRNWSTADSINCSKFCSSNCPAFDDIPWTHLPSDLLHRHNHVVWPCTVPQVGLIYSPFFACDTSTGWFVRFIKWPVIKAVPTSFRSLELIMCAICKILECLLHERIIQAIL